MNDNIGQMIPAGPESPESVIQHERDQRQRIVLADAAGSEGRGQVPPGKTPYGLIVDYIQVIIPVEEKIMPDCPAIHHSHQYEQQAVIDKVLEFHILRGHVVSS